MRTPSLKAAITAIIARNGLFAVALIGLTLLYWQLGPVGEGWWIVPALLFAGLWLSFQGLRDRADHAAIARLVAGDPPRNGQWTAIAGKAQPLKGEAEDGILALHFTITQKVRRKGNERASFETVYDGRYLVPTGIETAQGIVPLLGFPDMLHISQTPLPAGIVERAKAAARKPPWSAMPSLARELTISGSIQRIEACYAYREDIPEAEHRTESRMLKQGDAVAVFGLWQNGKLRASFRRARGMPLYEGSAAEVLERLRAESKGFTLFGAVVLALALGVAIWSLV